MKKTIMERKKVRKRVSKAFFLMIVISFIATILVPDPSQALQRVVDFDHPKASELYSDDNFGISRTDHLYTGTAFAVVRGEKTGTLDDPIVFRQKGNSNIGYTFYKPSQVKTVASAINGNPDYVYNMVKKTTLFKTIPPSTNEIWNWTRDIGREAGATVDLEAAPGKDESGQPKLRVVFYATKYPTGAITAPKTVKVGERFFIEFDGQEYDPYDEKIKWGITTDGPTATITSGEGNANGFTNKSVSYAYSTPGLKTVSYKVTDRINRTTEYKINIMVVDAGKPLLEITPPVATIYEGETQPYRAYYTDENGKRTEVTKAPTVNWTTGTPSVGTIGNKTGVATGVKQGQTSIVVQYNGLKATAKLNVLAPDEPPPTEEPPPEEPPPVSDGSSECAPPRDVPKRYEYEMDLSVSRIDARTVDEGSDTVTDVYVKRANFSSSRDQAKDEFATYIHELESMKATCESKKAAYEAQKKQGEAEKAQAESQKSASESQLASLQSGYSSCLAIPADKDGHYPDCSSYSTSIANAQSAIATATENIAKAEQKIKENEAKIKDSEGFIALYDERINLANVEVEYIKANETQYYTVQPTVKLRYGQNIVGTIAVSLKEGEGPKRYSFPKWTLTGDGTIMAQINETGPYDEFYYDPLETRNEISLGYNHRVGNLLYSDTRSNNWKSTPIYVSSYATAICPAPTQYFNTSSVEGIVRTVNDEGTKRVLKERVTTSFSLLPRKEMRAGYGFEYRMKSVYQNFDTEPNPADATGMKRMEAYFPTLVNYLPYQKESEGYKVPMQTSDAAVPRMETREWKLPPVAVEEFSGNTFAMNNNDYLHHPERDPNEKVITKDEKGNSLNRWYVDFKQPDGDYVFKVKGLDAGVNHLNTCHVGNVVVKGSPMGDPNDNDDFVSRSIDPNKPFPAGTGWNWTNQTAVFSTLTNWWNNWPYPNPDTIPAGFHEYSQTLTPEIMEKIRQYNKAHRTIIRDHVYQDEYTLDGSFEHYMGW
ncbi:hypothetical protein [Priestia koreensis]|uniref:hypothetical protein n=1 Tax=Priestia koreensis TaxID=284581 RepID=UPI00301642B0